MKKNITRCGLLMLIYGLLSQSTLGATIQTTSCFDGLYTSCASGVTGLSVGSGTYDVLFIGERFSDSQSNFDLELIGDQAGAVLAAQAIRDALNATTVDAVRLSALGVSDGLIWVPFYTDDDLFIVRINNLSITPGGWEFATMPIQLVINNDGTGNGPYAIITSVPIPSSAFLMCSALFSLVGARYYGRKSHNQQRLRSASLPQL